MRAVSITNRGGRKHNEDFVCSRNAGDLWCYALCDGLGGHAGGEIASKLVAEAVCGEFKKAPEISPEAAEKYVSAAARELTLARVKDANPPNMATTVALLLTDGRKAVWANIGDSRVYYINKGEISQITEDHSIAFIKFESGIITYDEIRRSPDQNKLLRCVGGMDGEIPDVSETVTLQSGDAFLVCSDGFWEYVDEENIEKTLAASSSPQEWLEKMLTVLHENESEYNDNYSAFAVMI